MSVRVSSPLSVVSRSFRVGSCALRAVAAMHISETVTATRVGYPHRFTLLEFYERFVLLNLDVMKRHVGYVACLAHCIAVLITGVV